MILAAAAQDATAPEIAHSALTDLCQTYWPPLYGFVRSRGHSVRDAQDLTQRFFGTVFRQLADEFAAQGKGELFQTLKPFVRSGVELLPSYDQLAPRLGMPPATVRSHVNRMRARYRALIRAELRRTVETEAQADEELHELLRVLTSR